MTTQNMPMVQEAGKSIYFNRKEVPMALDSKKSASLLTQLNYFPLKNKIRERVTLVKSINLEYIVNKIRYRSSCNRRIVKNPHVGGQIRITERAAHSAS